MFLRFPYDIQLLVISFAAPHEIAALSCTCRHLRDLCSRSRQEHITCRAILDDRWPCAYPPNIPNPGADEPPSGAPRFLVHIAQNPRLPWYVTELRGSPSYEEDEVRTKDVLNAAKQLLTRSSVIAENEVPGWIDAIAGGGDGAALGVLLCQMTHLIYLELDIEAECLLTPFVTRAISRLATRSSQGLLGQPLSSLTKARVSFYTAPADRDDYTDSDFGSDSDSGTPVERRPRLAFPEDQAQQDIRLITALARLPNIHTLSLQGYSCPPDLEMEVINAADPAYPLPSARCQISSFIIDLGVVSGGLLSQILDRCHRLENFRYMVYHSSETFGERWRGEIESDPDPDMTVEATCRALLKHAQSTLRHLHIEMVEYGGKCGCRHEPCLDPYKPFISINPCTPATTNWGLYEFTNLERLTLDIDLFSNAEDGGWLPFADTLPTSIKDVVILAHYCPPGTDQLDFENMFRDFKPQSFPRLQSISAWHQTGPIGPYGVGQNGAGHILPTYRRSLELSGIPSHQIRNYRLDAKYFAARQKQRPEQGQCSYQFGSQDYYLYALPPEDTEGKVILGVYQSTKILSGGFTDDFYDGIVVEKTWCQ